MLYWIFGIATIYLYYVLFFGTDQDKINEVIKEIEDYGLSFTAEEYVYNFLRVEVKTDNQPGKVTLAQGGFTKKVMKIVVMLGNNKKTTPAATMPLGTYADGNPFDEPW